MIITYVLCCKSIKVVFTFYENLVNRKKNRKKERDKDREREKSLRVLVPHIKQRKNIFCLMKDWTIYNVSTIYRFEKDLNFVIIIL